MFTGLFLLFIKATTTTSPLVTLPLFPPHSSVDHGQHAGHRPELYASLYAQLPVMPDWETNPAEGLFFARFEYIRDSPTPRQSGITDRSYYFTARYFTRDQCGEWKNGDFRGEISYFTHELYAQNCIKIFSSHGRKLARFWFGIYEKIRIKKKNQK